MFQDYDYAYDYSEMTIKPQNSSTPKPLNTTTIDLVQDSSTETVTETIIAITPSGIKNVSLTNPLQNDSKSNSTFGSEIPDTSTASTSTSSMTVPLQQQISPIQNSTICKKGFIVNNKGECELKLQPSSTNA